MDPVSRNSEEVGEHRRGDVLRQIILAKVSITCGDKTYPRKIVDADDLRPGRSSGCENDGRS